MLLIWYQGNQPAPFAEGLRPVFPKASCCNCGTTAGVAALRQDSRMQKSSSGSHQEFKFQLELPFCGDCAGSAKRRPQRVLERGLVALGVFGAVAASFLVLPESMQGNPMVQQAMLPAAGIAAGAVLLAWWLLTRPKGKQTSFFQPVRILDVRTARSGAIDALRLAFTNPDYRRAFETANRQAVGRGALKATKA
jgi:hypothetical protein